MEYLFDMMRSATNLRNCREQWGLPHCPFTWGQTPMFTNSAKFLHIFSYETPSKSGGCPDKSLQTFKKFIELLLLYKMQNRIKRLWGEKLGFYYHHAKAWCCPNKIRKALSPFQNSTILQDGDSNHPHPLLLPLQRFTY